MIFAHLARHLLARRGQSTPASWILSVVRSLRVLRYWREHQALCRLDLVRRFVAAPPNDDLFHHLSHRSYLATGLSARQRVQCVLSHYRFEDSAFGSAYHQLVYGAKGSGGLCLWQQDSGGHSFLLRLEMAPRGDAEGDLTISLVADGKYLHRLSYTWIDGRLAGVDLPTVPFVTRNQGRWIDSGAAFDAFELAFPNNSPSFFCFAAMQGVAQALGIDRVIGIKCSAHIAYNPRDVKHFENAYDGFWKVLGGTEMPGRGYLITLPFYLKPLSEMPSKHRKRAAQRREYWRTIGDATRSTLLRHMVPAQADQMHKVSTPATAQA
ncbi:VirK/YbjX family protein [Massilia sp. H6]|uniref:VirK/YbjX family protein n=1 Tax=Massilia sp. H6 TaxID=2970464 RepID=UPI002167565C|nr:VirK/YbjX family protein [Massilia sp. H6]UVW27530.1 VirK/YbjX family protein [Massilia sp. H6]